MKINFTFKIWILIIILVFSLISVFGLPPKFLQSGVLVTSVETNSTAFEQGLRQGQIIISMDEKPVSNLEDFTNLIQEKFPSQEKIKTIIQTTDSEIILFSKDLPEITVSDVPKTGLKTGLDLSGGARALVKAENKDLTSSEVRDLVDITTNRLNEFGLSDINVVPVSDLSGENYMLIEIAGATPQDLDNLISQQGKFQAKINNETVFIGGDKDVSSVCRNDATCSGIESCSEQQGGTYACNFRFVIYLSEQAAKKHANITASLGVNSTNPSYLSAPLELYVDDKLVDTLLISKGLQGRVTTQIQISGSGQGQTQQDAYNDAKDSMHKLQTILITGSLPYKLEVVKLDTISPLLGKEFIQSILLAGLAALIGVSMVILARYKNYKFALALLFTSISEVIIILGIASFIEWNLDLPSIAGILVTIGTGIDQQIIVLDESKQETSLSLKQKLKRAFAIILGAYFTAVVAMLPLLWAGAGLLKGFAITTIIGITAGVLITRPAFTDIIRKIEE